jgi:hypothetical protein
MDILQQMIQMKQLMCLQYLHFLRSTYKMFFGNDRLAGTPPPVLRLSGHGALNYNSVPCVLQNFAEIMPADRDYIEVPGTEEHLFHLI